MKRPSTVHRCRNKDVQRSLRSKHQASSGNLRLSWSTAVARPASRQFSTDSGSWKSDAQSLEAIPEVSGIIIGEGEVLQEAMSEATARCVLRESLS